MKLRVLARRGGQVLATQRYGTPTLSNMLVRPCVIYTSLTLGCLIREDQFAGPDTNERGTQGVTPVYSNA